jgi:hypothetical protein
MAKWVEINRDYDLKLRKGQFVSFASGSTHYVPNEQAEALLAAGVATETTKPEKSDTALPTEAGTVRFKG